MDKLKAEVVSALNEARPANKQISATPQISTLAKYLSEAGIQVTLNPGRTKYEYE